MYLQTCAGYSADFFNGLFEENAKSKRECAKREERECIIALTKTEHANEGNVSLDHCINCSAVVDGNVVGTNNPPLGAYPANRASSKVNSSSPPRVDLYFISLLFVIVM
jgi:hypothetical protein